ncbi:hypothetical protein [Roseibium polysiphoniae]|uniref:hypothetical protein n=1 Tax=Roseibium polysiphoniae TaxID=2571221 RepID=UPI003298581D
MTIRTFADIEALADDQKLTEAEQLLLDNCRIGEFTIFGDGERPSGPSLDRTIRADLLRYLILGGCDGCQFHEWGVHLQGAWIVGPLDLSFATAKGATLLANCGFDQKANARQSRFEFLELNGSALPGLNVQDARVAGDVKLEGLKSKGEANLSGAQIGGQLSFIDAQLDGGGRPALNAQSIRVKGGVFLSGLKSKYDVSLSGAEIGGQLECEDAELDGADGFALIAHGVRVTGDVFLSGLKSKGEVSLSGAEFGGSLDCEGAELDGAGGDALNAQGLRLTGAVFLGGLKSKGEVSLSAAEIGGPLVCQDAELKGSGGHALNAHSIRVKGGVSLSGLKSKCEVSLSGAAIGGQLDCEDAELDGGKGVALNAQRLIVKEGFLWRQVKSVKGAVELTAAHLGDLVDDAASWDKVADVVLVGLTYDNLVGPLDLEMRKAWLQKGAQINGDFHPQPYQQLARFYRETGHRREARDILIEKEIQQRRASRIQRRDAARGMWRKAIAAVVCAVHWIWDGLSSAVTGYGLKPWKSLWTIFLLIAVMTVLAQVSWNMGDLAPNSDVIQISKGWQELAKTERRPSEAWIELYGQDYETFEPFFYAADVVIPIIDIGQTEAWTPSTERSWWGWSMFGVQKIFVILGWGVTAIVAAAVTGMIRRDD